MKRARDVRDQLVGLMERVELEMESSSEDHDAIKKVGGQKVVFMKGMFLSASVATCSQCASVSVVTQGVYTFSWMSSLHM